jgi:hypothetical protein
MTGLIKELTQNRHSSPVVSFRSAMGRHLALILRRPPPKKCLLTGETTWMRC